MLERRTLLTGLAALPAAGLPVAALAVMPAADPFATYEAMIQGIYAEIAGFDPDSPQSDDQLDEALGRKCAIDEAALAGVPTTLAGAIGALELARREYHQFRIEGLEDGPEVDITDHLVLHLIDGALGVLRPFAGGGVA